VKISLSTVDEKSSRIADKKAANRAYNFLIVVAP